MQRNQPERDGPEARRVDPLLEVRERKRGARPGDAYVRIVRPFEDEFERSDEGTLIASEKTILDRRGWHVGAARPPHVPDRPPHLHRARGARAPHQGQGAGRLQQRQHQLQRLRPRGDHAGAGASPASRALFLTVQLAALIIVMLAIVTVSYRQTIKAYPMGASSYIVASDNLGDRAGILAASALLIGYTVTVAVSVSAGVAAMTSIIPQLVRLQGLHQRGAGGAADARQPARHPRVGLDLHGADLPVHRRHAGRHRLGPGAGARPARWPPFERAGRRGSITGTPAARRWDSSSSCAPSRRARWR